ncbi:MAG: efflux RND transporter periplasmic adaptor subunit [Syntrophobacteraceae bacterium]
MKKYEISANYRVRPFSGYGFCIFLLIAVLLEGCSKSSDPAALPVPEVGVLKAAVTAIPLDLKYTAHTRGIRDVEVRSRVSGILLKRNYREGSYVNAGDLLFEIDSAPFLAEAERTQGQLAAAWAQLGEATILRDRLASLVNTKAVARHDYETSEARCQAAKASMEAAQASLRRAKLDLEYTRVVAPISGFTSREVRSEGSLVEAGAESSLLTTITQDDRLYVDFSMPEDEARQARTAMALDPDAVRVRLIVGGEVEIPDTAKIEFIDTRVAVDTSTVDVRAVFDNRADKQSKDSNGRLSPGQYVRVRIEGIMSAPAVNIPSRAVMFGADGPFVWVLDDKDIVKPRPVRLGPNRGNLLEIAAGLTAGDCVIIDGILKVKPDATVKPVTAALEGVRTDQSGGES